MISNNKILTVSYGTFSCTLEGFEDNFGTMKAIAEYFRDLAADDRYFGAEPPQPDVEMLARIAEREIERRVDAREHEGRFVLSAGQAQTDSVETTPEDAPVETAQAPIAETAAMSVPEVQDVSDSLTDAVAQPVTDSDDAPETQVATAQPEDAAPEVVMTEPVPPQITETAEMISDVADTAYQAEEFFTHPDVETVPEVAEVAIEAEAIDMTEAPAPDSIAAKLQRIRAVVSKSQEEADGDDMFEDEYAEDLAPSSAAEAAIVTEAAEVEAAEVEYEVEVVTEVAEVEIEIEVTEVEGEFEVETTEAVIAKAAYEIETLQDAEDEIFEEDESEADDVAAILARFDSEAEADAAEADAIEEQPKELVDSADAIDDDEDQLFLDTLAAFVTDDETVDEIEGDDSEVGENLFEPSLDDDLDEDELDELESIEVEDEIAPDADPVQVPRARVIKVKRSEIDAAIASGALEELDVASDAADVGALSDEQEAELLADLAEVEAELDRDEAEPDQDDTPDSDLENMEDTDEAAAVEDDDVTRLMAEVDHQMDEPEGTSRRSAFAHLKAAVMAKKADLGIGKEDEDKDGDYRSDLASVVKPRRPKARGSAGRPEDARPAPLKLVAEQRVDIEASTAGPLRPRRVTAREDAPMADADASFEDYAAEMGAHDLPELLEAAASYLSFVEGREQFSRPQLMNKVRMVEKEDFSREDGLRSFGQLLRAGKIEKIKGGRFAVTGDIGYRPDHRAAG